MRESILQVRRRDVGWKVLTLRVTDDQGRRGHWLSPLAVPHPMKEAQRS